MENQIRFAQNTYIEDEDFTARSLFLAKSVCVSDQYVYAYYHRHGSIVGTISNIRNKELNRAALNSIKRLQDFTAKYSENESIALKKRISTISIDIFRRALRAPNYKELVQNTINGLKSMGIYPIPIVPGMGIRFIIYSLAIRTFCGRFILRLYELDKK